MEASLVQVTQDLIRRGESGVGGWNRRQIELLGILWPPKHGWRRRVEGKLIPQADAEQFVALRGVTKKMVKRHRHETELLLNFDAD